MVIASTGQRMAHSAQRMQRSSSFRMAEFSVRSVSAPSVRSIAASRSARGLERVERHQLQTRRRAHVDAATAEHAARAVEDRRDTTIEAARCLAARLLLGVAEFDQRAGTRRAARRRRARRQLDAPDRLVVELAPVAVERNVRLDGFGSDGVAGDVAVHRARRLLARRDRVDQQARPVRQVAGDEYARRPSWPASPHRPSASRDETPRRRCHRP